MLRIRPTSSLDFSEHAECAVSWLTFAHPCTEKVLPETSDADCRAKAWWGDSPQHMGAEKGRVEKARSRLPCELSFPLQALPRGSTMPAVRSGSLSGMGTGWVCAATPS